MPAKSRTAAAYLSVDMEGCATLVHWDEVRPSAEAAYRRACEIMTDEVNAVIDGLVATGVERIVVNDSHSKMRNVIADRLRPAASVVNGAFKPGYMLEGMTPDFDLACFIGYHGAIGDERAVMGHTYSPRVIHECRLGGEPVGELAINAALAGHYGVPVMLVSGDQTTIADAKRTLPWAIGVQTKESISYYSALGLSPARVREQLADGARRAVSAVDQARPLKLRPPLAMEIDTCTTAHADVCELIPSCRRLGARTIEFRADEFPTIYRALVAAIYIGVAAAS